MNILSAGYRLLSYFLLYLPQEQKHHQQLRPASPKQPEIDGVPILPKTAAAGPEGFQFTCLCGDSEFFPQR